MTNILVLEPSTSGLQILPIAQEMGLKVFTLSANTDERIIPYEYHKYIFKQIHVDTNDKLAITKVILDLHNNYCLSAVLPGFEIYVSLAAYLAQIINAPGLMVETAESLRNKWKMRNKLNERNVRIPKFIKLDSLNSIKKVADYIDFPCVIKPIDQSGSIGVSRINNITELTFAYSAMCNNSWTEMGKGIGTIAIVEEYIMGEEYSVEGYVGDNNTEIVSITKKFLTPEPLFIEMGHIVPAQVPIEILEAIKVYVREVVSALNVNVGVFHAELRMSKEGPVLMEIAGRLPGCRIADLILLAKGVNMYEIMIKSHLGQSIVKTQDITLQYAGMCYFDLNGKNYFHQVRGIEDLKKAPGFYDFRLLKKPGEFVPLLTTFEGRVASAVFTAPTYQELLNRLTNAKSLISFTS